MPARGRWWIESAKRYAESKRVEGVWSRSSAEGAERCLRAWPGRFTAAGLEATEHAQDVTAEMVLAWKEHPMGRTRDGKPREIVQPSAFQALFFLRGFLGWAHAGVAKLDPIWRGRRGDATHRRWFSEEQIQRMWDAAPSERHRLVLALGAWAGLRRRELWSLLARDVDLSMDRPALTVTRKGGARKYYPISKAVANALRPFVVGRGPADRVYPLSYRTIYRDVAELAVVLGVPASPHDLRRSFGRILYARGVNVNTIRALYNHAATEQTLYYIGETLDGMREVVGTFDAPSPRTLPAVQVSA
ncbi:MAG: site-specific integrase [Thermoplasmata archaeon]|nr:site-specific integrase [Thermoplasmata archaeon]